MTKVVRKKIEAVIETTQPKGLWQKTKDWFYNSHVVVKEYITGIIGAGVAIVGFMDWSPLWSLFQTGTSFTKQQLLFLGVSIVGSAVTGYMARTAGTKVVDGHLLPKAK